MLWFIIKQMRRVVRKIGHKIGAISPYDFYDWRTPWASNKEINQDKLQYNVLNKDDRFILDNKNDYIIKHLKHINTEHGIGYIPTYVRDLWSVKQICKHKAKYHYDCGSSFSGFITPLIPLGLNIVLIDIRDLTDRFNTSLFKYIRGGGGNMLSIRYNYASWDRG